MNNSKLVNVLRTFSKSEMKEFEKLVSSPFFNKGRNYVPLLNELKKFYPKFDNDRMTPEYIYSKLYPGKRFNRQIIWNMMSSVYNMIEEFLLIYSLKKNRFERNGHIADEFLVRKLSVHYSRKLDDMEEALDNRGIDGSYFLHKRQLESKRALFHFLEDTQHLISRHIVKKGEYTIINFLKTISGVIHDMEANQKMFNAQFEINLPYNFVQNLNLEEIIKYAKSNNFIYAWVIEMYYCSILMITDPDIIENYSRLKKLFEEHFKSLTGEEINVWITVLTNYCIKRAAEDDDYFRREVFEINKLQLKEGILLQDRYLSKILFVQILRNAILVNETGWAENFIGDFVPMLKPSYQKTMRALGFAYLNFKLKNFDAVIDNLKNVKFIDSRDKLNVRNLYIRTYYELNEIEAALSQIESTKQFINKNNSFTIRTKDNYLKSLNLVNRLITAISSNDKRGIEDVGITVESDSSLIFGKWLREKIKELGMKKS